MSYADVILESSKAQVSKTAEYVIDEVNQNEKWIRETIRERWLLGKRPDGSLIGIYASRGYAADKHAKNPLAGLDHVDLTLTGSLGKGIKVSLFGGTQFEIYSTNAKYNDIADAFGDVNFNLSEAEKDRFFTLIGGFVVSKQANLIY